MEELLGLPPEKVLLKWMNFHLKKAGYEKQVTNFSSDVKVRECSLVDESLNALHLYLIAENLFLSWHGLGIRIIILGLTISCSFQLRFYRFWKMVNKL